MCSCLTHSLHSFIQLARDLLAIRSIHFDIDSRQRPRTERSKQTVLFAVLSPSLPHTSPAHPIQPLPNKLANAHKCVCVRILFSSFTFWFISSQYFFCSFYLVLFRWVVRKFLFNVNFCYVCVCVCVMSLCKGWFMATPPVYRFGFQQQRWRQRQQQ